MLRHCCASIAPPEKRNVHAIGRADQHRVGARRMAADVRERETPSDGRAQTDCSHEAPVAARSRRTKSLTFEYSLPVLACLCVQLEMLNMKMEEGIAEAASELDGKGALGGRRAWRAKKSEIPKK